MWHELGDQLGSRPRGLNEYSLDAPATTHKTSTHTRPHGKKKNSFVTPPKMHYAWSVMRWGWFTGACFSLTCNHYFSFFFFFLQTFMHYFTKKPYSSFSHSNASQLVILNTEYKVWLPVQAHYSGVKHLPSEGLEQISPGEGVTSQWCIVGMSKTEITAHDLYMWLSPCNYTCCF